MLHNLAYILALVIGWVIAQGIKYVIALRKDGLQWSDLTASGGMPSSHSSTVLSVVTLVGIREGFYSASFGLGLLFAAIVMYDAVKVRRTTGENTLAIKELAKHSKAKLATPLHVSKGHTPREVAAGAVLGIIVGLAVATL